VTSLAVFSQTAESARSSTLPDSAARDSCLLIPVLSFSHAGNSSADISAFGEMFVSEYTRLCEFLEKVT
jgi:hypothetical protein